MRDDLPPPTYEIKFHRSFGVSGPREPCRGCGASKPAGFRNFCSACGKYPVEVMAEREHDDA